LKSPTPPPDETPYVTPRVLTRICKILETIDTLSRHAGEHGHSVDANLDLLEAAVERWFGRWAQIEEERKAYWAPLDRVREARHASNS
jgi:hypothetical protein